MSRWKSPPTAARRAERAAQEAEQLRKEKRNSWLMISGVALVSISLCIADYFWIQARAQKRREEHRQRQHLRTQTNSLATPVPMPESHSAAR